MDVANGTRSADSKHTDHPENIIITTILAVFSVLGTTGNAFVFYVFYRKKDKNTSTVFILTLAMIDFLTCLLVIPFTIVVEFLEKKINDDAACKVYSFMTTCSIPFSAFIMVAIAFDRYFCICRPWVRVLDIKTAKRIICVLFVFVVCLGITTSLAHGVYQIRPKDIASTNGNVISLYGILALDENNKISENQSLDTSVNLTGIPTDSVVGDELIVFNGYCYPNEIIMGLEFRRVYQKFYVSLFIIAFVTVSTLYGLIYRSILVRRSRRLKASLANRHLGSRHSTQISSITTLKSTDIQDDAPPLSTKPSTKANGEKTLMETTFSLHNNGVFHTNGKGIQVPGTKNSTEEEKSETNEKCGYNKGTIGKDRSVQSSYRKNNNRKFRPCRHVNVTHGSCSGDATFQNLLPNIQEAQTDNEATELSKPVIIYRRDTRKSVREKTRIANIKTAGILFTVTVVFIIAFLPAWLMATKLIPANIIGFYMHFSYNVANPIIYAFFNHTFQNEVRYMLKCQHYLL